MGSSTRNSFIRVKKKMQQSLLNGEMEGSGVGFAGFVKKHVMSGSNNTSSGGIRRTITSKRFVNSVISLKKIEFAINNGLFDDLGDDFESQSRIIQAQRLVEKLNIEYEPFLSTSLKEVYEYKKLQKSEDLIKDWIKKICVNFIKYNTAEDSLDVFGLDNMTNIDLEINKVVNESANAINQLDLGEQYTEEAITNKMGILSKKFLRAISGRKEISE